MSGGSRSRAIAWRHARQAAICDRVAPWAHGTVVAASTEPTFHEFNAVRLEGPDPGLGASELAAAADALQAGFAHRRVEVEDEAAGARLRPGLEALGWTAERHVWMERRGAPTAGGEPAATAGGGPAPAPVAIAEAPFARTRALREAWAADSPWGVSAAFLDVEERVAARAGTRALIARGADGEPVGYVAFVVVGDAAEIDQAYVTAERRGAGIGGALVAAAVAAAGTPTTFIAADDAADAKRLYARLGFAPAWRLHLFTRTR